MLEERFFTDGIRLEIDAETLVAVVTIDRPPVNPTRGDETVLRDTFSALGESREVNCCVLTGGGDRAFCAGVDLRAERPAVPTEPTLSSLVDGGRSWRETKAIVLNCGVPVIGAINGAAVGAGVGLAASCDILVCADHARFSVNELNIGALGGGSALLRLVGTQKMRTMYFTCDFVSAQEMYRLGAVEQVVPADELMPAALDLAARIASKSPIGLRMAKASLNRMEASLSDWDRAYRLEQDYSEKMRHFEDSREARAAWNEKRPPVWNWR